MQGAFSGIAAVVQPSLDGSGVTISGLRPYQIEAVEAIRAAYRAGNRAVLFVAPTGAGKTRIFAHIAHAMAARGSSIVIVAHRAEICDQISEALALLDVPHGRISPGHPSTTAAVQIAMVQTLARRIDRIPVPQLIITDEAHHILAASWRSVRTAWPKPWLLGVTATPERLDGRGLGDVFEQLVLGPPMRDLIEAGYLARYTYLAPKPKAVFADVRTVAGDYAKDEIEVLMDQRSITGDVIEHYRRYLDGRPVIAFCVTVAHAEHVAEQFREAGYRAASVDGSMDRVQRRDVMTGIGDGRLNVLTSCELISEGVDVPIVAGALLLRPTQSLAVHLQQCGRCMRPKPDGGRAVILDHVGNVGRHGLPDDPRAWSLESRRRKAKEPGITTCQQCYRVFATATAAEDAGDCQDPECPILYPVGGVRGPPAVVDGQLSVVADPWAWLRPSGIDPALAKGPEFRALLALADTRDKLRLVARVRRYHPQWVRRVMAAR